MLCKEGGGGGVVFIRVSICIPVRISHLSNKQTMTFSCIYICECMKIPRLQWSNRKLDDDGGLF